MFVSTNQLVKVYGVDEKIARFFVDREPPENNLYWHEKLLYLRPAPGYLFIPLIVDLLYKSSVGKESLLSEDFIGVMENIGHISALEETKQISAEEAVQQCIELVEPVGKNEEWLKQVTKYLQGNNENLFYDLTTPFKALHRGDIFLFSLAALPFPNSLFAKLASLWFALISTLLLLDDAEDIESDKETGDENAFIESGLNNEGIQRIKKVVALNIEHIKGVNPTMAAELERQSTERYQKPDILELIK